MVTTALPPSNHPLAQFIHHFESGGCLLEESEENLIEVVGILKSYGVVLDAYSDNLLYIANHQFLVFFPFFKYFNSEFSWGKLFKHWWHDRINFEYAEYCMRAMLWHGTGGLDAYLDTDDFVARSRQAIEQWIKPNPFMGLLYKLAPEFFIEQTRMFAYYSGLGQFWRVMSDIFLELSDRYDRGEIKSIDSVVIHILEGLVAAANQPMSYEVTLRGKTCELVPLSEGLTFLPDLAVPYVEAIFFRGTPFPGTVSYNAQAQQIPLDQTLFSYGALYADPLPIGGSGIPPTLLMQDMRHFLPDYLMQLYQQRLRGEDDLRVKICQTFQKSMFCVTTAALKGLMPYPAGPANLEEQQANRTFLEHWCDRFMTSQLRTVNPGMR